MTPNIRFNKSNKLQNYESLLQTFIVIRGLNGRELFVTFDLNVSKQKLGHEKEAIEKTFLS